MMFSDFRTEAMFSGRFKRLASALVLFFFTFTFYSPAVLAAFNEVNKQANPPRNSIAYTNPLGETLQQLAQEVDALKQAVTSDKTERIESHLASIQGLSDTFEERDADVRQQLNTERQSLTASNLPDKILDRQQAFEVNYSKHADAIRADLKTVSQWQDTAKDQKILLQTLADLDGHLQYAVHNPRQSFGNDLDFVKPAPRNLYTSQSAIEGVLGVSGEPQWDLSDYLDTDTATADSERIQNIVSDLGRDPLALYKWVHDTIRFVPSYGVMQGADYTIQSAQGNAFDTASTLIALYRDAGIPARYRYGTVALPAAEVQNWVGGVSNVDAATNILSQGGIPQQQLSYGGASEQVELEHVWVEAWINGEWVGLDPSFKQHTFKDGLDIKTEVPLDAEAILNDLKSSATVNEAEGWVQGLNASTVQTKLDNYKNRVKSFIDANQSEATLGDVLGTQDIVPDDAGTIEDVALPYDRVRASAVIPNLPESLAYRFRLQIGNTTGGSFGAPVRWAGKIAELDRLTPTLVGKSLAISFRPATEADAQTLESYLPESVESVDDLPEQLPANTIQMIGEITVDGQVVATTPSVTLGQSLMTRLGFDAPERSWRYSENNLVTGQYQAVGIDMQGISPDQLTALKNQLEGVKTKLTNENYTGLTKHDLVGGILQSGIQGYLAETYAMDKIAAKASDIVYNRSPSYGTFSTQLNVSYFFGTPRNVLVSGVVMDVDNVSSNTESRNNCYDDWVAFNRSSGMRSSAYEHLIPERLFSTEDEPLQGVSTAKALTLAMAQGQKVYTLNSENASSLNQITIDSAARSEIQAALQRGYEVTVHAQPINVNGWEGSGYSIIDPERGVGAYKISGGTSGGVLNGLSTLVSTLLGAISGSLERFQVGNLGKVIFSDALGKMQKLAGSATKVGYLALAVDLLNVYKSGDNLSDSIGSASVALFSFAVTSFLITSLLFAAGPVLGFIAGALIATAITTLTSAFNDRYFNN